MALFEKLSGDEKKMMERYIDSYAFQNDGSRSASLEYIMRVWDSAKQPLFHMFGDQFILSREITFTRGEDELSRDIDDKLFRWNSDSRKFIDAFYKMLDNSEFRYTDAWYAMRDLMDCNTLARNIYNGASVEIPVPNSDKPLKISHNCRVTRALGKIAAAFNLPNFEEFRIAHSMVLNQKKLSGNMCLSIHPLDYMTMSDNECDWTSCMSWNDYGCYRQGTVEMMNSPCVIVAYLTAAEDMHMPGGYHWNSKKWRQLFIVKPELITNIKAYPYRNDELTKFVLDWLKELAVGVNLGEYTEQVVRYDAFHEFTIEEFDNLPVQIDPCTYQMYNDFSDNQFAYFGKALSAGTFHFYYSGDSECMSCGSTNCDFDGEGSLVGTCCEERYYCDCCGEYYSSDEDFVELDGQWVCSYCAENNGMEDSFTGELHHEDNMKCVYLSTDGGKTVHSTDVYSYYDDMGGYHMQKYFKAFYSGDVKNGWRRVYWVNAEDLTDEGLKLFDFENLNQLMTEMSEWSGTEIDPKSIDIEFQLDTQLEDAEE